MRAFSGTQANSSHCKLSMSQPETNLGRTGLMMGVGLTLLLLVVLLLANGLHREVSCQDQIVQT